MANEYRTRKDLEGSSHGLTEVLFWNLPGRTEKSHKRSQSCSWCLKMELPLFFSIIAA
jgi:hypothetical protein